MAKSKLKKSPLERYFGSGGVVQLKAVPEKIVFSESEAREAKEAIEKNYNRKRVNWEKLRRIRFDI